MEARIRIDMSGSEFSDNPAGVLAEMLKEMAKDLRKWQIEGHIEAEWGKSPKKDECIYSGKFMAEFGEENCGEMKIIALKH